MADQDPRAMLDELKATLERLAAPAADQIAYLRALGDVSNDELALEFDDVAGTATGLVTSGQLSREQGRLIAAVEAQLSGMSGPEKSDLWTDEALRHSPEWTTVRKLAARALASLRN